MREENDFRIGDEVELKGSPSISWNIADATKAGQFKLKSIGFNNSATHFASAEDLTK